MPKRSDATDDAPNEPGATGADSSLITCDGPELDEPAVAPAPLADIDAPFYPCAFEVTAVTGTDPVFVGEYVTSDQREFVETTLEEQIDGTTWVLDERTQEGENTVNRIRSAEHVIYLVVAPTRTGDGTTSIHYTVRSTLSGQNPS